MANVLESLVNKVFIGDCIKLCRRIPSNSIDLIIVDPPYNLGKPYNLYRDRKRDDEYVAWSKKWIKECIRVLKYTGSLFIINLPKWALHYMIFLNERMYLQHTIAWFSLSVPRGKIMPTHYTILWYTKSRDKFKINRKYLAQLKPYPRYTCLRHKWKKEIPPNLYEELTDIWYDIHRIRHRSKRYRDHPCQLPEALIERIILLTTESGDIVLDPMFGTGTVLLVAKKHNRNFIGFEIDPIYVKFVKNRLGLIQ